MLGDDSPTQDETIQLLGQLHAGDLIQCEVSPDVKVLFERGQENRRKDLLGRVRNPLALRIRLMDPDRLLDRVAPVLGWFFSPLGLILWAALVLPALLLAATSWDALSADFSGRVLSPTTLTLTMLVFPVMKAFHELAHGLAVKRWGAEVTDPANEEHLVPERGPGSVQTRRIVDHVRRDGSVFKSVKDDEDRSQIREEGIVQRIHSNIIGLSFKTTDHYGKLGQYLFR